MLEIASHKPLVHYYIKRDNNGNENATHIETDRAFVRVAKKAIAAYLSHKAEQNAVRFHPDEV